MAKKKSADRRRGKSPTRKRSASRQRQSASPFRPREEQSVDATLHRSELQRSDLDVGGRVTLSIDSMTLEGQGVARVDGYVVFVAGAIPGESVNVEIISLGSNFGRAQTVEPVDASDDRVTPRCRHVDQCGGCTWQHIDYAAQRKWKEQLLCSVLEHRLPRVRLPIQTMLGTTEPWGTRHKIHYSVFEYGRGKSRRAGLGHHQANSDKLLAVRECPVHHPAGDELARTAFGWLRERDVPIAAPHRKTAGVKSILVRTAGTSGVSHVVLVATGEKLQGLDDSFVESLLALPNVSGVHLNIQPDASSTYVGATTNVLGGEARLIEEVGGVSFHVSPDVFFQTNAVAAQQMLDVVLRMAGEPPDQSESPPRRGRRKGAAARSVLDLYSGVGLFSLPLAKAGFQVTAVEENPRSVADGIESVKKNGIRNCRFIESRTQQYLKKLPRDSRFDTVILDPPRDGCPEWAIRILGRGLRPKRIINVSCNPQALASDLSVLTQSGYSIREIQPIDMFPHTPHIESVTLLERE
ncbi:MAG: 23S rRNA (uracil(1939)-C(5))-methyltransferase RlmD [Planctomycetota bacterium]|jgi:23S rRNA (uracil-5-)-methyltransferase RumA